MNFSKPVTALLPILTAALSHSPSFAQDAELAVIPVREFNLEWETSLPERIVLLRVWRTEDGGKTWSLYSEARNPDRSAPVKLENDGVFGFYTEATDAAGLSEPAPSSGMRPKVLVAVDTKKPTLTLVSPNSADVYANTQDLRIEWTASDINFGSNPIDLFYSSDGGSNWIVIQKGLANTGSFAWKLPALSSRVYRVKAVAKDAAENESEDISDNDFTVDGLAPVSRITDVKLPAFDLAYSALDMGGAGIARVVLYYRTRGDERWSVYGEDQDLTSPITFSAKVGGYYSFKLVCTDRVGNSEEVPTAKTRPDIECLMDSANPVVKLLGLKGPGIGPLGGGQEEKIRYEATDDNMAVDPISIELSLDNGITWRAVASSQPNSGVFAWSVPANTNVVDARIRVSAIDMLSNKGLDVSDPFRIDSIAPKTSVRIAVPGGQVRVFQHSDPAIPVLPSPVPVLPSPVPAPQPTTEVDGMLDRAEAAERMGELVSARKLIGEALIKAPGSARAHSLLGRSYFRDGKLEDAIGAYSRANALSESFQDSRIGLGLCYFVMGQEIREKDPDAAIGHYNNAALQYEAAVKILPDIWDEHYLLGHIYVKLGKYDAAIKYLEKAIPLSGNNSNAYWYLGQAYTAQKKMDLAIAMYEKARESFKPDSEFYQKSEEKIRELRGGLSKAAR